MPITIEQQRDAMPRVCRQHPGQRLCIVSTTLLGGGTSYGWDFDSVADQAVGTGLYSGGLPVGEDYTIHEAWMDGHPIDGEGLALAQAKAFAKESSQAVHAHRIYCTVYSYKGRPASFQVSTAPVDSSLNTIHAIYCDGILFTQTQDE